MLRRDLWISGLGVRHIITSDFSSVLVRARLQSAAHHDQVCNSHVACKRIPARSCHFTLDVDGRGMERIRIAMDQYAVPRLELDILCGIARERLAQAHAKDF